MIRFTKMHGIGNDYIYINGFEESIADPVALSPKISDRHFGIGADGLILVLPPEQGIDAHVRMRMFNADGSESEMCGNGIRCVCKFAHDRGIATANPMKIQTGAGVLELTYRVGHDGKVTMVTVDMGEPVRELQRIGVTEEMLAWYNHDLHCGGLEVGQHTWIGSFVSMGNPHAVFFADENRDVMNSDLAKVNVSRWGPLIEQHAAFPRRINAHFVQVHSRVELTMRTWERGSGITLACGTGASAVCVASVLTDRSDREILAHLPGGDLILRWDAASNHVFKTGPATEVFTGEWVE